MTDEKKKNGDAFRVDVPDDLLEEAEAAIDKRVAEAQVNTGDDDMPAELSVDMEASATEAEAPDIEKMTVDELLNSGFLPDKIVAAFLEERTKAGEMRKQLDMAKERIASLQGEAEGFRKRLTKEKDDALKFATEPAMKELLPIIDNLERAVATQGDLKSIREGVEITLKQANHVLQKLGVTRVNIAKGTPFDPRFHEAVQQVEDKTLPVNSIAMVLQNGFLLHDRLLRPAMVAVARGGAAQAAAPAPAAAAPAAPPAAETPEQRLERVRRAGQAAREARLRKKEEEEAKDAKAASSSSGNGEAKETPEEKLERIRKTGQAAREARLARKQEAAKKRAAEQEAKAKQDSAAADARAKETPEEKLARIRKTGEEARKAREAKRKERDQGDAQSIAAAEAKEAGKSVAGETPDQKLERIRRTGQAAREARRKKREAEEAKERAAAGALEDDEAVAEAEAQESATAATRTETPEEKLARIRKTGQAAREARQKKQNSPAAAPANPLAGPAFEDDDLDNWESTVDSIRTDKSTS